jgi:hypothetical protein
VELTPLNVGPEIVYNDDAGNHFLSNLIATADETLWLEV